MTKKRFLSALLTFALLVSACAVTVTAVEPRASKTLSAYAAVLSEGDAAGELILSYDVMSGKIANQIGVSCIKIYKGDDTYVGTIWGLTSNGLIREDSVRHKDDYSIQGISGQDYYLIVTVRATIGSDTDTREITTDTVTAP